MKHTFCLSLSIWMSFCHIVCCTLWTSKDKLYILIINMWNGLVMRWHNLFEIRRQWFEKKSLIYRKKLLSLYQTKSFQGESRTIYMQLIYDKKVMNQWDISFLIDCYKCLRSHSIYFFTSNGFSKLDPHFWIWIHHQELPGKT